MSLQMVLFRSFLWLSCFLFLIQVFWLSFQSTCPPPLRRHPVVLSQICVIMACKSYSWVSECHLGTNKGSSQQRVRMKAGPSHPNSGWNRLINWQRSIKTSLKKPLLARWRRVFRYYPEALRFYLGDDGSVCRDLNHRGMLQELCFTRLCRVA